jgi:hypothetical protein
LTLHGSSELKVDNIMSLELVITQRSNEQPFYCKIEYEEDENGAQKSSLKSNSKGQVKTL